MFHLSLLVRTCGDRGSQGCEQPMQHPVRKQWEPININRSIKLPRGKEGSRTTGWHDGGGRLVCTTSHAGRTMHNSMPHKRISSKFQRILVFVEHADRTPSSMVNTCEHSEEHGRVCLGNGQRALANDINKD